MIQPQINSFVVAERFDQALEVLDDNQQAYGSHNELLYLQDYGLVAHLAGRYKDSIKAFEQAKDEYDKMFTVSLSDEAKTWLVNDNAAPYRGEDFERVMINVFQAMNFVALDNIEGALIEARDVNDQLQLINRQYKDNQKNIYKEDAFARFLMGVLYEAEGSSDDLNDAYISYAKAVRSYEIDYMSNYMYSTPQILKENILATAQFMGDKEFKTWRSKFYDTAFVSLQDKQKKGEVYLIQYYGLSPIKHQVSIPIPLPGNFLASLSFPRYDKRDNAAQHAYIFKALNADGQVFAAPVEKGEDIAAIAIKNLDNRKARIIAKGAVRSSGKYMVERTIEQDIEKESNKDLFKYISSLYNVSSEQADLRSWQTLPAEIRISRLILEPGDYEFFLNKKFLQKAKIHAGQKKFIIYRTNR